MTRRAKFKCLEIIDVGKKLRFKGLGLGEEKMGSAVARNLNSVCSTTKKKTNEVLEENKGVAGPPDDERKYYQTIKTLRESWGLPAGLEVRPLATEREAARSLRARIELRNKVL